MPRKKMKASEQLRARNAAIVTAECQPKKKSSRPRKPSANQIEKLIAEVEECIETNKWGDGRPALLVGVFLWAHREVYGVDCTSEIRASYVAAVQSAKKMVAEEFSGEFDEALDYVRMVWRREAEREEWRRKNTKYGKRITWRHVFVWRDLITEMRIEYARKHGVN